MSKLICEVSKIKNITPHPNADRLEIAEVKGWFCIVPKGVYKAGDRVLYIPIDSMIPTELAEKFGVLKYLTNYKKDKEGNILAGRVRTCKLRGEISQGLVVDVLDPTWKVGKDVTEELGIFKYELPVKASLRGKAAKAHPDFHIYTDIQRWQNYPDILQEGEEVIMTEKIHGTNFRCGRLSNSSWIRNLLSKIPGLRKLNTVFLVGSHRMNLKRSKKNKYWLAAIKEKLDKKVEPGEVPYGELYGEGIQKKFDYNLEGTNLRFYDIKKGHKYLDWDEVVAICNERGLQLVPVIYRGPFSIEKMKELGRGKSSIADHIKEGLVIKPVKERWDENLGRVVLKYISPEYDALKAELEGKIAKETGSDDVDLDIYDH